MQIVKSEIVAIAIDSFLMASKSISLGALSTAHSHSTLDSDAFDQPTFTAISQGMYWASSRDGVI
jgi:hypothetical protein